MAACWQSVHLEICDVKPEVSMRKGSRGGETEHVLHKNRVDVHIAGRANNVRRWRSLQIQLARTERTSCCDDQRKRTTGCRHSARAVSCARRVNMSQGAAYRAVVR